jgi:UTP--glucose-1-phosphate uridylyltransferase
LPFFFFFFFEKQKKDIDGFMEILRCYEDGLERGTQHVDWSKVSTERVGEMIVPYEDCFDATASAVNKLAILKLNGGLGTTMGCTGPKSVIEVREGKTFLDLIVDQVCELKQSTGVSVPLVLMNSFNTHEETGHVVRRYESMIDILSFEQSQHPRFSPTDHMPVMSEVSEETLDAKNLWYPPGHGDVFEALCNSGTLAKLEQRGIEYIFISNVDNLGATVDFRILNKMIESGSEFVMELTAKTEADVKVTTRIVISCFEYLNKSTKGGTLVEYEGKVRLLELAQVPKDFMHEFTSLEKFKGNIFCVCLCFLFFVFLFLVFNTNNIWVKLASIKRLVAERALSQMELIENTKKLPDGRAVIQLERAMGSAIRFFR